MVLGRYFGKLPSMFIVLGLLFCSQNVYSTQYIEKENIPSLSAKAVLVVHNSSGNVLLARNADSVRPIASLTKLVAVLVARSRGLKLDSGTEINREDWKVALDGARTRLELKWTYRNRDLLHAALLASDNRAISALGRAVGFSATGLIQAMNEYVRRLDLPKTRFTGPVGIDPENVSTAREVSKIVQQASSDPVLRAIMGKSEHRVKPMRGYLSILYRNTNPLVGTAKNAVFVGSKTGFNAEAGYCLATVADVRGIGEITFILLGCKSKNARVNDLRVLLQWVGTLPKTSFIKKT